MEPQGQDFFWANGGVEFPNFDYWYPLIKLLTFEAIDKKPTEADKNDPDMQHCFFTALNVAFEATVLKLIFCYRYVSF